MNTSIEHGNPASYGQGGMARGWAAQLPLCTVLWSAPCCGAFRAGSSDPATTAPPVPTRQVGRPVACAARPHTEGACYRPNAEEQRRHDRCRSNGRCEPQSIVFIRLVYSAVSSHEGRCP